ncbi:MAG TPA: N-6 DNA methylase [Candidatus Omnitrophota bacterium]|nr:N-6 DNA methylase [Candidatus Omnitrophota bacterium]
MLNAETKRKIDGLRDTLVGKIPVPTEQVKLITLGLIYKFMSDIDQENKELGGKSFFAGEYEQYAWHKLMDRSLSSYERVAIYSEGLEKMALNPNIPQLFRDIFKGAFLPFRDPATVDLFLRGINDFHYEHSEDLGDAFEYLISIMGTQGEAGQFRTPRHIIDFIVKAVDPRKTDTVLDPACGTAGFLISAYKHILEQNMDPQSKRPGSALTTAERNKLSKNFVGYDISHDMVRLSLVNMYLHQFGDPKIYEYDTLTSLDHWEDNFDCILTNPPFMTPKGGIRPHKRFAVKAKKSEVLFVDYVLEHLNKSCRAGIIVPEGIIENDATAYISLRKTMIDSNFLYAIISLPVGTFQPYSANIKTSILFFDRMLAGSTNTLLHLKVDHDGFDLGKNRNPIQENDLPFILSVIKKFQSDIESRQSIIIPKHPKVTLIDKNKIRERNDYSLMLRYYLLKKPQKISGQCEMLELGQLFDVKKGSLQSSKNTDGEYDFITASETWKKHNTYTHDCEALLFAMGASGSLGRTHYVKGKFIASDLCFILTPKKDSDRQINFKFYFKYFTLLREKVVNDIVKGAAKKAISAKNFKKHKVPYLPIDTQEKIVKEIEDLENKINNEQEIINRHLNSIESYKNDIERKILSSWQIDPGPFPVKNASKKMGIIN